MAVYSIADETLIRDAVRCGQRLFGDETSSEISQETCEQYQQSCSGDDVAKREFVLQYLEDVTGEDDPVRLE